MLKGTVFIAENGIRLAIADGLWSRAYYGPMLAAQMQTSALPETEPVSDPVDEMEAE